MYQAFNIDSSFNEITLDSGVKTNHEANKKKSKESLQGFSNLGTIDGSNLTNHWFPSIKADVFISHSHADEEEALRCASWLKNSFGLDTFIDSSVWGYSDELLREIDNKYCLNKNENTYSYEKRNGSTSHVHMMLATALSRMMDEVECIFFLNSPNSIKPDESIKKTKSPWLMYELDTLHRIRRKKPQRKITRLENFSAQERVAKSEPLRIEYEVSLESLKDLSAEDLNKWAKSKTTRSEALDYLYQINTTTSQVLHG